MIKKSILVSVLVATFIFVSVGGSEVNAACGAGTNTTLRVRNTNLLIAGQWSTSTNVPGLNASIGNIGANSITSGPAVSITRQTIVGNSNINNINLTSGGATSTTNVVNTGAFTRICD